MTASLVVFFLFVLSTLNGDLFEPLEKNTTANAAPDCTKLNETQCGSAPACILSGSTCGLDPCFEKVIISTFDGCNGGANCEKYDNKEISFCLTKDRKSGIDSVCGFEWGDIKIVEEGFCYAITGCEGVTPIEASGATYYICNKKPAPTDPCNKLTEEICPYIGKCMWEGGECVADNCWEKTYSSLDSCNNGCERHLISGSGASELSYCKTGTHVLNSSCNAGTGTNILTKSIACMGYPTSCNKIVTINNYEGDKLYVCSDVERELTVPSAALPIRISTLALLAIMLLVFSL